MKVYRIEDERREGPFQGGPTWRPCPRTGHRPHDGRFPRADGIGEFGDEHVFGCRTLADLRTWFRPVHARQLAPLGYVLAVYDAPVVLRGGTQVAFDRSTARLVEQRPVTSLHRSNRHAS